MKRILSYIITTLLLALILVQCAKRGSPSGGPVDELPPVILRAFPENYSTNFKAEEIIIQFDEYIKFKDLRKQLVISPPLKNPPIILPQGGVSRELSVYIQDTLPENTTYVLNFGQSVVDNNESNPYPYLKYVFSTGDYIDSLQLKGRVNNVLEFETSDFVNILLYEIDSTYTDSSVFKEAPNYVLNTLDSLETFTMENLKAGTYRLFALKEENSDYRYDPSRDLIAFYPDPITLPSDKVYDLNLFKQLPRKSIKRGTHEAQNRIHLGFTGDLKNMDIIPVNTDLILESRILKLEDKDTLQYWFKPTIEFDSILLTASDNDFEEEFQVQMKKDLESDSLVLSKAGKFALNNDLQFTASTPIEKVDVSKIQMMDKDSTFLKLESTIDRFNNIATLSFEKIENQRYVLDVFPGAVTDFFGEVNADTLRWNYSTKNTRDYGNIFVNLTGGTNFPVIVQIVTTDLNVIAEKTARENGIVEFELIDPKDYLIRLIYDENGNGKFDPGNVLENRLSERIKYFSRAIELKPNWDVNEIISLD